MEVVTRVAGPEPGYIACSIVIVQVRCAAPRCAALCCAASSFDVLRRAVLRHAALHQAPTCTAALCRPERCRGRSAQPQSIRPCSLAVALHPSQSLAGTLEFSSPDSCGCARVQAALTLLEERSKVGAPGGVFTVGALLRKTSYVERLQARGIVFERTDSARVQ